jgi:hypothetical protein
MPTGVLAAGGTALRRGLRRYGSGGSLPVQVQRRRRRPADEGRAGQDGLPAAAAEVALGLAGDRGSAGTVEEVDGDRPPWSRTAAQVFTGT